MIVFVIMYNLFLAFACASLAPSFATLVLFFFGAFECPLPNAHGLDGDVINVIGIK